MTDPSDPRPDEELDRVLARVRASTEDVRAPAGFAGRVMARVARSEAETTRIVRMQPPTRSPWMKRIAAGAAAAASLAAAFFLGTLVRSSAPPEKPVSPAAIPPLVAQKPPEPKKAESAPALVAPVPKKEPEPPPPLAKKEEPKPAEPVEPAKAELAETLRTPPAKEPEPAKPAETERTRYGARSDPAAVSILLSKYPRSSDGRFYSIVQAKGAELALPDGFDQRVEAIAAPLKPIGPSPKWTQPSESDRPQIVLSEEVLPAGPRGYEPRIVVLNSIDAETLLKELEVRFGERMSPAYLMDSGSLLSISGVITQPKRARPTTESREAFDTSRNDTVRNKQLILRLGHPVSVDIVELVVFAMEGG